VLVPDERIKSEVVVTCPSKRSRAVAGYETGS
jgi:hypothetical protein